MTERSDRVRMTSCTRSARRFVGDLKKVVELRQDTGRRRSTFGARWGETNLRAIGAARDEEGSIKRLCLSPYVKTFNSKVIKRFCTWTRSRYMFSNFEFSMFFMCSTLCIYVMNVPCTFISQIAVFTYSTNIVDYHQMNQILELKNP